MVIAKVFNLIKQTNNPDTSRIRISKKLGKLPITNGNKEKHR